MRKIHESRNILDPICNCYLRGPHSSRLRIPIPCCISQLRWKLENCALSILVLQPVECGSAIINLNRTNQTLCKERKLNTFIKAIGSCVLLALLPCCCKLDIKDLANTKPLNTNATLNRVQLHCKYLQWIITWILLCSTIEINL